MSQSFHIEGFKHADAKYHKMKAALDACLVAGVKPPEEVRAFFGPDWEEGIDVHGFKVNLGSGPYVGGALAPGVMRWAEEMRDGFEVDLDALDKSIRALRFYVSY